MQTKVKFGVLLICTVPVLHYLAWQSGDQLGDARQVGNALKIGDIWKIILAEEDRAEDESWRDILHEESNDVYDALPNEYLAEYKSFCWQRAEQELLCLPSVYLAGMPKCGSTDLYDKMLWHPQLARPSRGKENHYWTRSRLGRPGYHLSSVDTSSEPFLSFLRSLGSGKLSNAPDKRLVDGTQSLLWDQGGWEKRYPGRQVPPYSNAQLLLSVAPRAKILVITRDPVERLYSDYLYFNQGLTASPQQFHTAAEQEIARFTSCLSARSLTSCCHDSHNNPTLRLNLGIYICFIREWVRVFPDQILVVTLEQYSSHPFPTLLKIFSFLELDSPDTNKLGKLLTYSKTSNERTKKAKKKGDMLPQTRNMLREFYSPYNSELAWLLKDTRFLYKYGK